VRAFPVRLLSGVVHWAVVDTDFRVHGDVDAYLQHLRLGRDAVESTTKAYAGPWHSICGGPGRAALIGGPLRTGWVRSSRG